MSLQISIKLLNKVLNNKVFVAGRQKILQPFGHNLFDVDDFHSYLEI